MSDQSASGSARARRLPALAGLALLVALLALVLGGWAAWRTAGFERATRDDVQRANRVDARLAALESDLDAETQQREAADRRYADVETGDRALHDELQGIDQRTRNLETALAVLSDQRVSGHDALLLDDAELLLRTGQQRFALFNDAAGALRAYTLAEHALAQVEDPAFAPVRNAVATERAELTDAAPPPRQGDLDALGTLRAELPSLPLAAPEVGTSAQQQGALAHLWHAFGGILRIQRDESAPLPAADARFARELAALDLAQAQAALLAFDDNAYRAALQRVTATLAAHFDANAPAVREARATLARLSAARPLHPAPKLGGALTTLRSLRATHALQTITPAAAATSGGSRRP